LLILSINLLFINGCFDTYSFRSKVNFHTWNDIKWQNVNRQRYDYSCIATATSTLLNYYFKDTLSEKKNYFTLNKKFITK
jgi:predicted double-glycine peptidase